MNTIFPKDSSPRKQRASDFTAVCAPASVILLRHTTPQLLKNSVLSFTSLSPNSFYFRAVIRSRTGASKARQMGLGRKIKEKSLRSSPWGNLFKSPNI
ncbi:hypothetical protein TNCT_487971 [Trichonephila clavata]|uniref:Uncharacterized protein n=1 Tax=Trichonephila clavata TaxID=2740835 RepID=A0A8X6J7S3_TRICU|nr:hypothetical protein TNCT_487971 [Trichonephila clavata]